MADTNQNKKKKELQTIISPGVSAQRTAGQAGSTRTPKRPAVRSSRRDFDAYDPREKRKEREELARETQSRSEKAGENRGAQKRGKYDEPAERRTAQERGKHETPGENRGAQKRRNNGSLGKKGGFPVFWCLYGTMVLALAVFWLCVVGYVKKSLILYENSQPAVKMEEIMAGIRQTGLDEYLTVSGEISRFETRESYANEFHNRVDGKILFYSECKGGQDSHAPKYELYADGELIGYISLKETSSEPLMVILTLSTYEIDRVELIEAKANESVRITIPEEYRAYINGQQVDDRERVGDSIVSDEFEYVKAYVDVPSLVQYEAKGLLERPSVEVKDASGAPVTANVSYENGVTTVSVGGMQESEMPEELSKMALENAERYTNFFSADLPGCRNSVSPIKDMFPSDSYYLELADTYRREDMWMYSAHKTPVFSDERVDHYVRYSEELFSCEVFFNKSMYLTRTGNTKVDTTHFRLYYGYLNGQWKILDIKTLLENE